MTTVRTTSQKREAFFQLHQTGCFTIPNPWNIGTAKCLEQMGFAALASTSSGHAYANGMPDGTQSLDMVLAHLAELAAAVNVPLNADFENGYADDIGQMQQNIIKCVATGIAGLSIEDTPQGGADGLYEFTEAVSRISAARAAIDQTGERVLLTARTEGFIRGAPDLEQTTRRIAAFVEAGADCIYAPGIKTREQISAVVAAANDRPVNVLCGSAIGLTVAELEQLGVRRISVGGALARVAMDGFLRVAQQIAQEGRFDGLGGIIGGAELDRLFSATSR
ncbi:2-methylisocitrate lyase [Advenella sp. S44]|uniref:isocitrate lyase/PEP mutase family protein n=1 Tax=Advenella sp. S44 TaxID=1982755 RepID=UPI000C29D118|nr:isocitrate lyase/phosphoenolpyruvate mutase family protein [Advenella sp. S44]PJX22365.1 2-methylisocitrate lyase [Advenella sp. S44]